MRNATVVGRVAAGAAVIVALIAVVIIVLSNGSSYQVKAIFVNASQIGSGNLVEIAGTRVGTVSNVALTPDGQAQLTLSIDNSTYKPLRQGTVATVRQASLSGIANRYIDLRLAPAGAPTIPNNGVIGTTDTTSAVDLDQLFNTLNAPTVKGLQDVIQGSASQYTGRGREAAAAWAYLNPAVASSSRLFAEINRDSGNFTKFLVQSSNLVSQLAARSTDLSGVVENLARTTEALAAESGPLGQSLQRLPPFMRLADTTFVNLRSALNDLTPLVNVSKPVAPKLQQLLLQLEPLSQEAVPTVHALANAISLPGPNNDLTDLTRLAVPLANATVRPVRANGKVRPGAFPESTTALNDFTPELAVARPYAVDLTGWFEGFSHPGTIDANGAASRVSATLSLLSSTDATALSTLPLPQQLTRVVQLLTGPGGGLTAFQGDRCPGSMERGALFYPGRGFPCNPRQAPTGP